MHRTLAHGLVEPRFVVLVHGREDPADPEWDGYVQALRRFREATGEELGVLVVTEGGRPNTVQRTDMNAAFDLGDGTRVPTAVVAESRMARGVVTALGWFNPGIKAFHPDELEAALEHLGVPPRDRAEVRRTVDALREELGLDPMSPAAA